MSYFRRLRARAAACGLLCCALATGCQPGRTGPSEPATPPPPKDAPTGQLPKDVKPLAYTLELSIDPGKEGFEGRTQIAVELERPTARIWLHGLGLEVKSAVAVAGDRRIDARYRQVDEHGLSELLLAEQLPAGQALLDISYQASFDKQLAGLYKVHAGEQDYAFTQFEPHAARKAFPCFDEPAFKTSFDVWLTVDESHEAIANTPALTTEAVAGGLKRIHYAVSKPLPTYLVAFAVGPLDVVEAEPLPPNDVRPEPLPFRGVAIEGKGPQLSYALAHTAPLMAELERYFGIPYPYEKLDVIAVPDFAAGAMENAGAITFREWLLLLDEEHASVAQRRAFAGVMAHELAHQWFGNLVTMPWWDDIWLNEAFATFMGHRTVAAVHPSYGAQLDLLEGTQHAMDSDSRQSARRIRQPIESTHDIVNAFDAITYYKGAAVLSMFERFLSPEVFRQGIIQHLKAHPHGVADSTALLSSLSEAARIDATTPFRSFLEQVGVPLLRVETSCAREPTLKLAQSRYLPAGSSADAEQSWQIPICVRYQAGGSQDEHCTLLDQASGEMALEEKSCPRWVMPNAGAAGYYRFALSDRDLDHLLARGFDALRPVERVSLVDNLSASFNSGAVSLPTLFETFPTLVKDDTRLVASAPSSVLAFTRDHLLDDASLPAFEHYATTLYRPLMSKLGWEERPSDDDETKLLRDQVTWFMAEVAREPGARSQAAKLGRELLGYGHGGELRLQAVPADLRALAARVAVVEGDATIFDHAYKLFKEATDSSQRYFLLRAMTNVRDYRSARALKLALDPALRVNEVRWVLQDQLSDNRTRDAAWRFMEENFDALLERLPAGYAGATPWFGKHFCSEPMAKRVRAFFEERVKGLTGGPRSLAATLETIRLCAAQAELHGEAARAFFAKHK